MLLSVDGFWITARVYTGEFTNTYFHVFERPGRNVYATISLSGLDQISTEPDMHTRASAYVARWTVYDEDGKISAPSPNSMGLAQNAVVVRNCATLEFALDVVNWVVATAQISIFQF